MSDARLFYRINTLMGFSEIDSFAALKKAGSRIEYFRILNQFVDDIPNMVKHLEMLSIEGPVDKFYEQIDVLQNLLLAVGSSNLMWEAEKVASSEREGKHTKCIDDAVILGRKLLSLHAKIKETRVDFMNMPARKAQPMQAPYSPLEDEEGEKPKAAIKPEPFEKLLLLIENFELDEALVMVKSMIKYSYDEKIDAILYNAHHSLSIFEYDKALNEIQAILKFVEHIERLEESTAKKKILAIDDVPDVLNTVKSILSEQYSVYGVTNHKSALRFLTGNSADLILLDIEMPDMDGFSLLSIIRKIKAYEKTPVLFLTGSISIENVKRSHESGANDFIRKPIDAAILHERISKHMSGSYGATK